MWHPQVVRPLGGIVELGHRRDVRGARRTHEVLTIRRRRRAHRAGLGEHDRVLVAELPVEVRDADHDLGEMTQARRTFVRPARQRPDQSASFVRAVGGDQLHLASRDRDVVQDQRLVQQSRGRHDPVSVGDDRARLPSRLCVLDD